MSLQERADSHNDKCTVNKINLQDLSEKFVCVFGNFQEKNKMMNENFVIRSS